MRQTNLPLVIILCWLTPCCVSTHLSSHFYSVKSTSFSIHFTALRSRRRNTHTQKKENRWGKLCHALYVVCRLVKLFTQLERQKSTGTISLSGRSLLDGRLHTRLTTPYLPLLRFSKAGMEEKRRLVHVQSFEFQHLLCSSSRHDLPGAAGNFIYWGWHTAGSREP